MTPYEVFFFSSGAVEEHWTAKDLAPVRANVFVGFPLGGLLSLAIAAARPSCCCPRDDGRPAVAGGASGGDRPAASSRWQSCIVGILAATFGAALETTLSSGYTFAQFFGWPWGCSAHRRGRRFHVR